MDNFVINSLPGLQYLYATFGYNFGLTRKLGLKLFLSFALVIWLLFHSINSITTTYKLFNSPENSTLFKTLIQVQGNWYYWIFFHYLFIVKSSLVSLVVLISNYVSNTDRKKISRLSYISLLSFLIPINRFAWVCFNLDMALVYYESSFGINFTPITLVLHTIPYNLAQAWQAPLVLLYLFIFTLLHCAKKNLLKSVKLKLRKFHCRSSIVPILKDFGTIFKLHSQFESNFNFFAFLLFSDLFFAFTRFISVAKTYSKLSVSMSATVYMMLFGDTIIDFSLIIAINYSSNFIDSLKDEIEEFVNSSYVIDPISKLTIVYNLDRVSKLNLSGLKMFNLEPSLFLSFTAALVSFTILFLST